MNNKFNFYSIISYFKKFIVKYNINKILMYFIKYSLILFIFFRILYSFIYILDYYTLLNLDISVLHVIGNENTPSQASPGIPKDNPSSFMSWIDNLSPIFVGYSVLKAAEKLTSLGPTGRGVAAGGAVGVVTILTALDKALQNSVGFNRLLVSGQELLSGKQISSIDSKYAPNSTGEDIPNINTVPDIKSNDSEIVSIFQQCTGSSPEGLNTNAYNWEFFKDVGNKIIKKEFPTDYNPVLNLSLKGIQKVANEKSDSIISSFPREKLQQIFQEGPAAIDNVLPPASSGSSSDTSDVSLIQEIKDMDKFFPSSDSSADFFIGIYERLYFSIISIIKPVYAKGYLDDLIGQRLFVEFLLLMLSIFILILFLVFILNLVLYTNKEKILKLFPKNKFFNFIISIEVILIKSTLIIIPFLIFIGFYSLILGHLWLISNPIPYDCLGIDLHQFVSVEPEITLIYCLLLLLSSIKKK